MSQSLFTTLWEPKGRHKPWIILLGCGHRDDTLTGDSRPRCSSTSWTDAIKRSLSLKRLRGSPLGRFVIFNLHWRGSDVTAVLYLEINAQEGERNYGKGERVKRALGNLLPSASLFPSLTSTTFNRQSQFAGRETPRWQEMKPPQLLDTYLAHSTILLFLSAPSSILLSAVSQHIKGLEEKHGDSLSRHFASLLFILYQIFTLPSSNSWASFVKCVSERGKEKMNVMKVKALILYVIVLLVHPICFCLFSYIGSSLFVPLNQSLNPANEHQVADTWCLRGIDRGKFIPSAIGR